MRAYSRTVIHRRVVVNLISGKAFNGVLVRQDGPLLVLKDAHLLEAGTNPVPLDGEVIVERTNVDFIQAT